MDAGSGRFAPLPGNDMERVCAEGAIVFLSSDKNHRKCYDDSLWSFAQ